MYQPYLLIATFFTKAKCPGYGLDSCPVSSYLVADLLDYENHGITRRDISYHRIGRIFNHNYQYRGNIYKNITNILVVL